MKVVSLFHFEDNAVRVVVV